MSNSLDIDDSLFDGEDSFVYETEAIISSFSNDDICKGISRRRLEALLEEKQLRHAMEDFFDL